MPELQENWRATRLESPGDLLPARGHLFGVDAGGVDPADALL